MPVTLTLFRLQSGQSAETCVWPGSVVQIA